LSRRYGLPIDPRNFHRKFKERAVGAGVPVVSVHSTRRRARRCWSSWMCTPGWQMQILRPHALPTVIMGVGLGSAQPTSEADLPIRRSQRNLRECPWMNARARLTYGRSLKDGSVSAALVSRPLAYQSLPAVGGCHGGACQSVPVSVVTFRRFARAPAVALLRESRSPLACKGAA
jgi:hypothetical protein